MWKPRWISLLGLLFLLLVVSACQTNTDSESKENQQQNHEEHPENTLSTDPLEVEIDLPDQLPVNQETVLKARLTQGKEDVNDAQEVQFEVWKANHKEQSEMIDGELEKDGVYTAKKTFKEDGIYYVQAHATARGMHVMPVKKIVVGEGSKEEKGTKKKEDSSQEQTSHQEHHHHH